MKTNTNVTNPSSGSKSSGKKAENKDNLDSRKNEEQDLKGDDMTNNSKETKLSKLKKK